MAPHHHPLNPLNQPAFSGPNSMNPHARQGVSIMAHHLSSAHSFVFFHGLYHGFYFFEAVGQAGFSDAADGCQFG